MKGLEDILLAGASVHLSARKGLRTGDGGGWTVAPTQRPKRPLTSTRATDVKMVETSPVRSNLCMSACEWCVLAGFFVFVFFTKRFAFYWPIRRSWFARVNALCNLSRKRSREVAAHFRADF